MSDAVRQGSWTLAVRGAIELSQPRRLETIIGSILRAENGTEELDRVIRKLCEENESAKKLIEFCRDWNAARGSTSMASVTHTILRTAFEAISLPRAVKLFSSAADRAILEALAAHSQRHYDRAKEMATASFFLDFTLHRMRSLAPADEYTSTGAEKRFVPRLPLTPHRKNPIACPSAPRRLSLTCVAHNRLFPPGKADQHDAERDAGNCRQSDSARGNR